MKPENFHIISNKEEKPLQQTKKDFLAQTLSNAFQKKTDIFLSLKAYTNVTKTSFIALFVIVKLGQAKRVKNLPAMQV